MLSPRALDQAASCLQVLPFLFPVKIPAANPGPAPDAFGVFQGDGLSSLFEPGGRFGVFVLSPSPHTLPLLCLCPCSSSRCPTPGRAHRAGGAVPGPQGHDLLGIIAKSDSPTVPQDQLPNPGGALRAALRSPIFLCQLRSESL